MMSSADLAFLIIKNLEQENESLKKKLQETENEKNDLKNENKMLLNELKLIYSSKTTQQTNTFFQDNLVKDNSIKYNSIKYNSIKDNSIKNNLNAKTEQLHTKFNDLDIISEPFKSLTKEIFEVKKNLAYNAYYIIKNELGGYDDYIDNLDINNSESINALIKMANGIFTNKTIRDENKAIVNNKSDSMVKLICELENTTSMLNSFLHIEDTLKLINQIINNY